MLAGDDLVDGLDTAAAAGSRAAHLGDLFGRVGAAMNSGLYLAVGNTTAMANEHWASGERLPEK